ncbi:MAG TPA: N-formylglutamate amidohydrolase [Patescibacteria group bacterium]|nr:N-formylglutamate amidohydrolase [Patescibacteria group bacterium]
MLKSYTSPKVSNRNFSIVLSHQQPSNVIISVPHDCLAAGDFSYMFQTRRSGVTVRDLHVWLIANDIVQTSFKLGVRVDAVRFLMARTYVDANRALSQRENLDPDAYDQVALEDQRLLSVYRYYHSELQRLVRRSVQKFGANQVLFIDLHGFGQQPAIAPAQGYDLILGTANRATILHGNVDVDFAKFMEQKNYSVFLPNEQPVVSEGDPFNAGQNTRWYAQQYGINAIQIEISRTFRQKNAKDRGEQLARDVAEFLLECYKKV